MEKLQMGQLSKLMPLSAVSTPIKTINYPINVLGGGRIDSIGPVMWGLAPTPSGDFLYVTQVDANRAFRIRNPLDNPQIDIIFGQTSTSGTLCNRGSAATSNSLCLPGSLSFDRFDNLYMSDHSLEAQGNFRLLMFSKDILPTNNTAIIYAPSASNIFPN